MIKHASPKQLLKFKKEFAMKKYQSNPLDTASLKVQAVCICEKVLHCLSQLEENKRNYKGMRKF